MNVFDCESDYEGYTETSDSEDQDDSESSYGGNAQSILSSLDESIGKIDDFLAYERGFTHGDVVSSITDPSGQLGRVVDFNMVVDLETSSGKLIKEVNSKNLLRVQPFVSGDYVIHGPWLGRVDRVYDTVTVMFSDGARCEIVAADSESLMPISSSVFEDAPYPYYPGQRVRIKVPTISKSVRWLCGSLKVNEDEGTVCNVEVSLVRVNWIASVMISTGVNPSAPYHLQNPKNLTMLSCYQYANWQLGDWCTLPSDYFHNLQMTTEQNSPPTGAPWSITKMQKMGMDVQYFRHIYVIAKTKLKVDILWQNGSYSVGLDSQTLFPVNNVGEHDFWPEQFVLEKVAPEDVHTSSVPRLGIVKHVDAQERTVKVKWKKIDEESTEDIVSAYELIEHPDFSYCIGDVVFRMFPHFENLENNIVEAQDSGISLGNGLPLKGVFNTSQLSEKDITEKYSYNVDDLAGSLSCIGNVIGYKDEGVEVKWATGLVSKVHPSEIFGLDKLSEHASNPTTIKEDVPENASKDTVEQEKESYLKKEKSVDNSSEACEKSIWDTGALLFPCASIRFFINIAESILGSSGSSLLGFWKGVPEFQILKPEEAHLGVDDLESECLKEQLEEVELKEDHTFSSRDERPGMFKKFDTVDEYSDHNFVNGTAKGLTSQVKRGWLKKIQQEWAILEKDLPDGIYVRVYEERIDLLRACIVGAAGTPYQDGLFFFDIFFPPEYPHEPPVVHYKSGGLRLNPNLYESGKVCLSLLKTWVGTDSEVWNPERSNILQVLLSLQALVLNDKPYFNEAGYDKQIGRAEEEKNSITYNENAFLLSCKSMMYILRKPPKHFEALVEEHFTHRSHHILMACKAYMDGAQVGCAIEPGKLIRGDVHNSCTTGFKIMLAKLFPKLSSCFTERGIVCS